MKSLVINVKDDSLMNKLIQLLNNFKKDEIEIVSKEDLDDLKLIKDTRDDEIIDFEEYLKNENKY
ncbi:hypothetical protein [Arcobacter vandammei]|uniref:hypothetical protein n=1 Tax=Arcobacter vandammei TaxID=2782243 RepID=UPI0018E028F4|nr:hypothetical protein [Arcobacter vandammei]